MTSTGFIPFDEPYKIDLPIEADTREQAEERSEEIADSIIAIAEPALKKGWCEYKINRPRKGAFKLDLSNDEFCAELTGTLTEGVSRWGGRFNYVVETNGHFPEVTGAISNASSIRKWSIYLFIPFFSFLVLGIVLLILLTTGWLVVSLRWIIAPPIIVGGAVGTLVSRLIIQRRFKKAVNASYQTLDRWFDVVGKIDSHLREKSASV